jgi:glycosyltransferase involved in cell wall biosynthesis
MALGKCVLITSGPTTDLILNNELAVIVPPEDPPALRDAIKKVFSDDGYRTRIAKAGQKYALSLGGESEFFSSLRNEITAETY